MSLSEIIFIFSFLAPLSRALYVISTAGALVVEDISIHPSIESRPGIASIVLRFFVRPIQTKYKKSDVRCRGGSSNAHNATQKVSTL